MANTQINQLPLYTGDTTGAYLVMNNSGETTTYKVTKENLVGITGSMNYVPYFQSAHTLGSLNNFYVTNEIFGHPNSFCFGTNVVNTDQPERLVVDNGISYNIATFQTSKQDSYAEVNIRNFGSGSNASTDLILWNDDTTESSSYVDLGINSSNYIGGQVGFGGDGYLFNQANDMYVGSTGIGDHGHLHLFGGNMWNSSSISIYNDGTIGFGTDVLNNNADTIPSSGFTYEFRGDTKFDDDVNISGSLTNTSYVVLSQVSGSLNFTNDADAATGGVPLGGLYRNGNFIMIRMS